jgi:broad specificity phosphatase PhoE
MGTLYLVRHGQASFGADDYDQLSVLGRRQARRLGAYWRERHGAAFRFDAVLTGTLQRQIQTWEEMAAGAGWSGVPHVSWPGLNEYDGHAVLRALDPDFDFTVDSPERRRDYFRALRRGLTAWMRAQTRPDGMPSYADFVHGVVGALAHVRTHFSGNVALVASGGPITTAVGHVLSVPPEATIEMNLFYRNSAVTEMTFTPKRFNLLSYNALPHLDAGAYRDWVTFA